jgi:hypothetical protein
MMQTDHLYPQVHDWSNLLLAHAKAALGKRGREPAARFEFRLTDELVTLRDELRSFTYRPGPYASFYIHERVGRRCCYTACAPSQQTKSRKIPTNIVLVGILRLTTSLPHQEV